MKMTAKMTQLLILPQDPGYQTPAVPSRTAHKPPVDLDPNPATTPFLS
jgi:hypothetical protein